MSIADLQHSNSLADLAARIRAFHLATSDNLRRSVESGIAAGELLIEAKGQLQHGQWLPWLRENCDISERTAQLYMRLAKHRKEIEATAKSATAAYLTLNETARDGNDEAITILPQRTTDLCPARFRQTSRNSGAISHEVFLWCARRTSASIA